MANRIQLRRDTSTNWTNTNPTLASGEFGIETDTGKLKVGNGATAWTSLSYWTAGAGDLVGPSSSVNNNVVFFDGVSGKLVKDSGLTLSGSNTGDQDLSGLVLKTTTVNGHALSSNVSVTASDVGLGNVTNTAQIPSSYLDTDTTLASNSDVKVATQKAVKTYADGLVVGLLDYRGAYNASENTYPTTGGSGSAGAVIKGDMWVISVAGTLGGSAIQVGDTIIANTDTPGQTAANWNTLNTNISYVPEDAANKITSISGSSTDTQYPSAKLVYDQLALKAPLSSPTLTTPTIGVAAATETSFVSPTANNSATGMTATLTYGATITQFQALYMGSGGKLLLAKADSATTVPAIFLAAESGSDTQSKKVILQGFARNDSWTWTVGGLLYLSAATAGALTQTAPSTSNQFVQILGVAVSATVIYFNPMLNTIKIA